MGIFTKNTTEPPQTLVEKLESAQTELEEDAELDLSAAKAYEETAVSLRENARIDAAKAEAIGQARAILAAANVTI